MTTLTQHPPAASREKLALHGGPKAKPAPYATAPRLGDEELQQLKEALAQQTLFYASGKKTKEFCERFAARYGVRHVIPCSSGTAALHIALGACRIKPGDEVITAPITDMGTLSAILLCGALPVFADLDPHAYVLDPASVAAKISPRTAAILPVHLAGAPCDLDPLRELAARHDLWLVEDCAQAYLTEYKRQLCGTLGDLGCFSLNDFKHIGAGDAGMLVTNDDELARKARLFSDKCYDRAGGAHDPWMIAPNYRMCELQAAVALAQLDKLDRIVAGRRRYGERLHDGLRGLPGLRPQKFVPGGRGSFWFYMLRMDENVLGPRAAFVEALQAEGLNASAGYIPKPVYLYEFFLKRRGFGDSDFPFNLAPHLRYEPGLCPNAEAILADAVRLAVRESFSEDDLEQTLAGIRKVAAHFAAANAR
ncbi:MAG: DegT/DnrJ/EryC1/StrS family aminotransferase [Planctomycetota bacterium]|nr:DegT/DnrJ/EryC1/StrS family aminotransferase [Planctomycetota bacterium]